MEADADSTPGVAALIRDAQRCDDLHRQLRFRVVPADHYGDHLLFANVERQRRCGLLPLGQNEFGIEQKPGFEYIAEGEREEFLQLEIGVRLNVLPVMQRGERSQHAAVEAGGRAVAYRVDEDIGGRAIGGVYHRRRVLQPVGEQEHVAQSRNVGQLAVGRVQTTADRGGTARSESADLGGAEQRGFVGRRHVGQREIDRQARRGAE